MKTNEEADTADDVTHEQVRRKWNERLARDIAARVVTLAALEEAWAELEQGTLWAQSL